MALQEKGKGLGKQVSGGKFIKTYAPGSSEHLAIEKIDALILALNGALKKLDSDTGVADTNYYSLWGIALTASDQLIQSPKSNSNI